MDYLAQIDAVHGNQVKARLVGEPVCQTCQAHAVCGLNQKQGLWLDIPPGQDRMKPGQTIRISVSVQQKFLAVVFAYILPLLLILATLFGVSRCTNNEALIGSLSLGVPTLYFTGLYLFRLRLKTIFTLRVSYQIKEYGSLANGK